MKGARKHEWARTVVRADAGSKYPLGYVCLRCPLMRNGSHYTVDLGLSWVHSRKVPTCPTQSLESDPL